MSTDVHNMDKLIEQLENTPDTASSVLDLMLTPDEIKSYQHFEEAVTKGGMDPIYFAKLCGMACACRTMLQKFVAAEQQTATAGEG